MINKFESYNKNKLIDKLLTLCNKFADYFNGKYLIAKEEDYLSNHISISEKENLSIEFSVGIDNNDIIIGVMNKQKYNSPLRTLNRYILDKIEEYIVYSDFNTYTIIDDNINNVNFDFKELKLRLKINKFDL